MDCIRIATLNIWNRSGPWDARLHLIRAELGRLAPDLLGLQEVLRLGGSDGAAVWRAPERPTAEADQATWIAAGFGYHVAFAPASDFGERLTLGNALLSAHPIERVDSFALPGAETGETRSLLYAEVRLPQGVLPVFVTHLNWKLHHGSVRVQQVRFIVDRVAELCPTRSDRLPPVLMGDFNAEPESDEIRYLGGLSTIEGRSVYFADVWKYAGEGPGYTFDRGNRFAALACEPPRRIDYIFVRGPDRRLRGEPVAARLAFDEASTGPQGDVWPSDHYGVITELVVSPRSIG